MPTYRVNAAGVKKARSLIKSHHYDLQTPWSEAAPSTEDANAAIDRHGYDGFGEWHLGVDPDASEETKEHFAFPFGDFSRLNRAALIHAKQRASQNGHDTIEKVAGDLLEELDAGHS